MTSERRMFLDMLAEMMNGSNEFMIKSKLNDSEEDDAESDPKSDPNVATHTTNGNSPHKLFINWIIPEINPDAIPPID